MTARERRSSRRERYSARNRRGGSRVTARLSRRELRQRRQQIAREQASSLKALERRLRRPLTRRERTAELRRIEARHRRDTLAARRRAEAARRAAIARQRAIEQSMRDEVQASISRDDTTGEDMEVRRAAVNALGNHIGTVVVMDPQSGRVYSIVNQEWALRRGFKPCSTIKLVTGVAGLGEKVIDPANTAEVSERYNIDLTDALAYSNNTYFQQVGGRVGFNKMMTYAREMGLGEKTGINAPNEFSGRLPFEKSGFALNRMSSHGDDFEVTAVQLATLVSAMGNGGHLLMPSIPRTPQDAAKFQGKVRRQIEVEPETWRRMVPGMVGAVNYGSGKKAYDPMQTVAGKTGTCIGQGGWVGLFTSYAPLANPRLAVVVIGRGPDARGHFPAAVAGRIYRELNHRFGTPVNLQFAQAPAQEDPKAADLNEEDKDAAEAEAAEQEAIEVQANAEAEASVKAEQQTAAGSTAEPAKPHRTDNTVIRNPVKRVLMPINRPVEAPKTATKPVSTPNTTTPAVKSTAPSSETRPRRAQTN
ncbi:MAG TPA: penicillin-binding transpeptidase domain-containing protein [Pyrinomonadaceae bacterium]|nr:penicillin-binding transpeptidase domain-containing protein [Pyrinomonadaceae bacterium]